MSAGFFRRLGSFIIDFSILAVIAITIFRLIGGPLIRNSIDDYYEARRVFDTARAEYTRNIDQVYDRYQAGIYTEAEYEQRLTDLQTTFDAMYYDESQIVYRYWMISFAFNVIILTTSNYVYQGVTKGYTLGRKVLKLRFSGPVNWWTLFIREVLWKSFFWVFTFSFGVVLDFILMGFTRNRKTIRDYTSGIRVVLEDVVYPF